MPFKKGETGNRKGRPPKQDPRVALREMGFDPIKALVALYTVSKSEVIKTKIAINLLPYAYQRVDSIVSEEMEKRLLEIERSLEDSNAEAL